MKNDAVLDALINFLVPIILLLTLFSLSQYNGFFSIIYAAILLIAAFMIHGAKPGKSSLKISIKLILIVGMCGALLYLSLIALSLTKLIRFY